MELGGANRATQGQNEQPRFVPCWLWVLLMGPPKVKIPAAKICALLALGGANKATQGQNLSSQNVCPIGCG